MAGETKKISAMSTLAAADVAATDEIEIVDKSDTTDASTGTNKKLLLKGMFGNITLEDNELLINNLAALEDTESILIIGNDFDRVDFPVVLKIGGQTEPLEPTAGMVYFNSASKKLRCYDGTQWNDLF